MLADWVTGQVDTVPEEWNLFKTYKNDTRHTCSLWKD